MRKYTTLQIESVLSLLIESVKKNGGEPIETYVTVEMVKGFDLLVVVEYLDSEGVHSMMGRRI